MRILYGKGIWPGRERKLPQADRAAGAAEAAPIAGMAHAIDMAHAIGARIIFFCTGQEGTYFQEPARHAVKQIAYAGLVPCACPVVTCRDPDAEAEVAIQSMLDGYAGLVFDMAPPIRGQSAGAARLGELMTQTELPQEVMFFSGPPNLSAYPDVPNAEMSRFCLGGFMPQAYASYGWNAQYTVDVIAYREFRCWTQAQNVELPIYPVLRLHRNARGQEPLTVGEMRSWLDALARYRPTFFSIRSPETIPTAVWPLLANIEMTPQGQLPPPGPSLEGEYVTVHPGETISELCARHVCAKEQFWIWNVHLWYNQGKPCEPEQLEAGWVVRVR
jgi:hypothetical protein